MVRARLAKKSFAKADEFFFNGKPRTLRIWDESFSPVSPIYITADDLVKLLSPTRLRYPDWAQGLDDFIAEVKAAVPSSTIKVPANFGAGDQFRYDPDKAELLTDAEATIYANLKAAAGKVLRVCHVRKKGIELVGVGAALPADLAPLIILDASARVSAATRLWAASDPKVRMMPAIVRDYAPLEVSILKEGCGNDVLEDPVRRRRLVVAAARQIDAFAGETLVIGPKPRRLFDLAEDLRKSVGDPSKVRFTNWGRHFATNDFRHVRQLIIFGLHSAPPSSYLAKYMAATGVDASALKGDEASEIQAGELRSNLLQAVCRGNIRNDVGGRAGECAVFLIANGKSNPEAMVRETFPGCTVHEWEPFGIKLTGQAKALYDYIKERVDSGSHHGVITKINTRREIGITSAPRFSQLLANDRLKRALANIGVEDRHGYFQLPLPEDRVRLLAA